MKKLYDLLWVSMTVVLSAVVVLVGYPAFEERFGFPRSVIWTIACVGGVWVTYLIRAYFWGEHHKGDE
jgi:hypothetical protein